ncbi:MAG: tyrosine-type recombinase/integrase [Nitrososphaerota archaeon]|nr:tyrosine-type recombinase/integrase [Nitrososphaerota archaeon]
MIVDIHDRNRKLLNHLKREKDPDVISFIKALKVSNYSVARMERYLEVLSLAERVIGKPLRQAKKSDLEKVVEEVSTRKPWTRVTYLHMVKVFYRWLSKGTLERGVPYPPIVSWIKGGIKRNEIKEPEVLSEEEIMKMIDVADNVRDKAFIAVLAEGGFRIGEILLAKLSDLQFDENGAKLRVQGKTGGRTVRLITSVPLLARWIDQHKFKNNPDAFIWTSVSRNTRGMPMSYPRTVLMLKQIALRAGINRRIYPHLFRHSSATRDAKFLTESELKVKYGWVGDSDMAGTYVHLAGADLDNKLLAIYAGRPVETIKPKFAPVICPKCGEQNTPGQRFCGRCGAPLKAEELAKGTVEIEELRHEISELKELLKGAFQPYQAHQ